MGCEERRVERRGYLEHRNTTGELIGSGHLLHADAH